jgi:hypothetical protein
MLPVQTVDFLNRTMDLGLTVPDRTFWLLVASTFLVIGTTIYKSACPRRVQEFSETHWVEELHMPRL